MNHVRKILSYALRLSDRPAPAPPPLHSTQKFYLGEFTICQTIWAWDELWTWIDKCIHFHVALSSGKSKHILLLIVKSEVTCGRTELGGGKVTNSLPTNIWQFWISLKDLSSENTHFLPSPHVSNLSQAKPTNQPPTTYFTSRAIGTRWRRE